VPTAGVDVASLGLEAGRVAAADDLLGRRALGVAHRRAPRCLTTKERDRHRGGREAGGEPGRRRRRHVLLDRGVRVGGQAERLGRLGEQEERAEVAGQLLACSSPAP
jgi:hypothetical protein